ncbi:MAG: caspase family protein [Acetobacteraceae bacterium]|nr:caspase family protein [Acetobacteraceae bacterium]
MIRAALALALWLVAALAAAEPERRVALVIGNADYRNAATLANPVRDAVDIATALNRLGFEVLVARDTDRPGMERMLREFGRRLEGASVGLFYYAGHGFQMDGVNFLVPVDARLEAERDVPFEAVRLELALAQMEDDSRTSIVILDACRDNPFRGRITRGRSAGTRAGLASVEAGLGTLIVYATQPNAVAYDGPADSNSPFAAALLRHINEPGIELRRMLTLVRADVVQATGRRQVPWDHSALMGDVYFRQQAQVPTAPAAAAPPAVAAPAAMAGSRRRGRGRARRAGTRRRADAGGGAAAAHPARARQSRLRPGRPLDRRGLGHPSRRDPSLPGRARRTGHRAAGTGPGDLAARPRRGRKAGPARGRAAARLRAVQLRACAKLLQPVLGSDPRPRPRRRPAGMPRPRLHPRGAGRPGPAGKRRRQPGPSGQDGRRPDPARTGPCRRSACLRRLAPAGAGGRRRLRHRDQRHRDRRPRA